MRYLIICFCGLLASVAQADITGRLIYPKYTDVLALAAVTNSAAWAGKADASDLDGYVATNHTGDVIITGDIEADSFTLNGSTITNWPTGGGDYVEKTETDQVTIDAANAHTNTFGGALTVLGGSVITKILGSPNTYGPYYNYIYGGNNYAENDCVILGSANYSATGNTIIGDYNTNTSSGAYIIGDFNYAGASSLLIGSNNSNSNGYGNAFGFGNNVKGGSVALGTQHTVDNYGVGLGYRALVGVGSFAYSDRSTESYFDRSDNEHEFAVRAAGGTYFATPSMTITGDVQATAFTLNGSTITNWPTSGGGSIDTNAVLDLIYAADSETYYTLTSAPTVTVSRANGSYQRLVVDDDPIVIALADSATNVASQITLMVEAGTNTIGYSESNVNYLPSLPDLPTNAVGTISYWSPVGVDSWTGTLIDPGQEWPDVTENRTRLWVTLKESVDFSAADFTHNNSVNSWVWTNAIATTAHIPYITALKFRGYVRADDANKRFNVNVDYPVSSSYFGVPTADINYIYVQDVPLVIAGTNTLSYQSNLTGTDESTRFADFTIVGYYTEGL